MSGFVPLAAPSKMQSEEKWFAEDYFQQSTMRNGMRMVVFLCVSSEAEAILRRGWASTVFVKILVCVWLLLAGFTKLRVKQWSFQLIEVSLVLCCPVLAALDEVEQGQLQLPSAHSYHSYLWLTIIGALPIRFRLAMIAAALLVIGNVAVKLVYAPQDVIGFASVFPLAVATCGLLYCKRTFEMESRIAYHSGVITKSQGNEVSRRRFHTALAELRRLAPHHATAKGMINLYDELQLRLQIEDATAKFRFDEAGRLEVSDMEKSYLELFGEEEDFLQLAATEAESRRLELVIANFKLQDEGSTIKILASLMSITGSVLECNVCLIKFDDSFGRLAIVVISSQDEIPGRPDDRPLEVDEVGQIATAHVPSDNEDEDEQDDFVLEFDLPGAMNAISELQQQEEPSARGQVSVSGVSDSKSMKSVKSATSVKSMAMISAGGKNGEVQLKLEVNPFSAKIRVEKRSICYYLEDDVRQSVRERGFEIPGHHVKVGDFIDAGSYGQVYRGTYRNCPVAIKVLSGPGIKPGGAGERQERRMDLIRREVSSLMMLRHPHILLACGFTTKEHNKKSTPSIALISELCRGGSVSTRIHSSRDMKVPAAVLISIQVSYAMTYLHGIGLQHRDIKTQNVLLVAHSLTEPHAKLGDFGLIRDVLKRTQGTPDVGTRGYCAPEIFAGEDYSYKADVYSFGLFLFEILSQRYPYDVDDMRAIHCERNNIPYDSTYELTHLAKFDAIEWAATQGRIPDFSAFELLAAKQATKHVQQACKGLVTECLAKRSGDRPDAEAISNRLEAVIIPK
jgi:hypothetical protein